jgi:hypothetical protein
MSLSHAFSSARNGEALFSMVFHLDGIQAVNPDIGQFHEALFCADFSDA